MSASDFSALEAWINQLEEVTDEIEGKEKQCLKDLAAEVIRRCKENAPVEKPHTIRTRNKKTVSVKGGDYKRGWTGGTNASPAAYADSLPVESKGQKLKIGISNNVSYAAAIEFGHDQEVGKFVPYIGKVVDGITQGARLKKEKVDGFHVLTDAENEVENFASQYIQREIDKLLSKMKG